MEAKTVMVNFSCWKLRDWMTLYIVQGSKRIVEWRVTSHCRTVSKTWTVWSPTTPKYSVLLSDYCIQFKSHLSLPKSLTPGARIHGPAAPKSFYLLISGSPELSLHLSSNEHDSMSSQLLRAVVPSAWDPERGDTAGPCDGTDRETLSWALLGSVSQAGRQMKQFTAANGMCLFKR